MIRLAPLAGLAGLLALPALAADPLSGEAIRTLVSGNTVEGSMVDSGRYAEFYAEDGTIRGEGYTGSWTVEADTMCFKYGDDPADCWSVGGGSDEVLWMKDGEVRGTGAVRPGNPNEF